MSIDLYYAPMSSPCRAVLLTAEAIGLPLNLIPVDILNGEQHQPEYEQLNPRKTVPFLVDGDYKLSESRAIMSYLVDQYGKNARLNPENPAGRALVSQRLHFDLGIMYKSVVAYYFPVLFKKVDTYDPELYEKLENAFEVLNKLLTNQDYCAGRNLTLADLALIATVTTAEAFGFDTRKYSNVARWMEKVKSSAPGYRKANAEGLEMFKKFVNDTKQQE
ncbi:glutathione S-transferase 1-1-like [Prorops nasuta]|uniref:glutathione S-transferase 1-1-like n=1 Tax=Prorops nasuta TaxID=863751 RepID=UPI0034CE8904